MSKFNVTDTRAASRSPIATVDRATTFEGGAGYVRSVQGELFLLAVTNMVSEATFYERGADRDDRFVTLVRQAALEYPEWTAGLLGWLRGAGNMRSASIVGAAEFVKARLDDKVIRERVPELDGVNRQVIASVLQRADEPGELLAYWTAKYGRRIPKPVKRGVADAVARLYTERALLKYDTDSHGFRFADVLDLVHPSPNPGKPWQGDLFRYALDRRHGRADWPTFERLPTIGYNANLRANVAAGENVEHLLDPEWLRKAGMTWEDVLSLAGNRLDKAKLWEALIPSMGYMALLRNLRNFDEAGVSDEVAATVAARLADPDEVARSRQFPMRFLSAYRAAPSLRWSYPLDKALGHSLGNIPQLGGRTLVLVDTSSSMDAGFSKDGTLMRWDAAVLFGAALAQRCASADLVSFSSSARYIGQAHGANTKVFPARAGESLLKTLERWKAGGYFLGGGTATAAALRQHFARHDRVVILTDEQAAQDGTEVSESIPAAVPLYTFNLAGYRVGHAPSGVGTRHTFGGLTDACFRLVPLLETGRDGSWPWE